MRVYVVATLVLIAASCVEVGAQTATAEKSDEAILRDLIQQADEGKQVIKSTEDLIFVSGAYPRPLIGRKEFEAARPPAQEIAKLRPNEKSHHEVLRLVVSESKDMAYEFGNYTISWDGGDSKRTGVEGSYVRIWRKQDGVWKREVHFAKPNEDTKPKASRAAEK